MVVFKESDPLILVGHQDIGVNVDRVFEGCFRKEGEIVLPVNWFEKTAQGCSPVG